ncbi:hypothetical protein VVD49_21305 [Uliginosibacterium sp. H3]|uniref:Uncharacterized protein n=1 Tax=Uliginosibacterium silvisoli TaxID=3114758 RepID=A0ABU6K8R2_9RHOO|nr:hypothetical protein [Uliginosibacterium sp. H3]
MSKVQKSNKESKKAPAMSLKEKRAAKEAKREGRSGSAPIQMPSATR